MASLVSFDPFWQNGENLSESGSSFRMKS